jgi:hypothetical protein
MKTEATKKKQFVPHPDPLSEGEGTDGDGAPSLPKAAPIGTERP